MPEIVMRYGVGYQGSKNLIAKRIIDFLPKAPVFVDLFGGGAMSHCAAMSGKYQKIIYNEISDFGFLLEKLKNGGFNEYLKKPFWINKTEYKLIINEYKKTQSVDLLFYLQLFCYSGRITQYGFSDLKAIVAEAEFDLYYKNDSKLFCEFYKGAKVFETLKGNELLKRVRELRKPEFNFIKNNLIEYYLKNLKKYLADSSKKLNLDFHNGALGCFKIRRRIEVMGIFYEQLKNKDIKFLHKSYNEVPLPAPSECVIYCDPPYANTTGYDLERKKITDFNHAEFYDFIENLTKKGYKVFFSEYFAPSERFAD